MSEVCGASAWSTWESACSRLYVLMEREGLAAALREVLSENLPQQRTPIDSLEFTQTEDRIYQIFLDHSPIGREEDFTAFYREVHGGPYDQVSISTTITVMTPSPLHTFRWA